VLDSGRVVVATALTELRVKTDCLSGKMAARCGTLSRRCPLGAARRHDAVDAVAFGGNYM